MQFMLNIHATDHRRCAPGLRSFETVNRGAKVVTADCRIEKMPDLVFRPPVSRGVRNRSEWGYFVECKIVDGAVTIRLYCDEGVARFVNGEYCARMPSGGMLAYVRDGSTPYASLQPRLSTAFETQSHVSQTEIDMSESLHSRREPLRGYHVGSPLAQYMIGRDGDALATRPAVLQGEHEQFGGDRGVRRDGPRPPILRMLGSRGSHVGRRHQELSASLSRKHPVVAVW
jgi:hypothetical protein